MLLYEIYEATSCCIAEYGQISTNKGQLSLLLGKNLKDTPSINLVDHGTGVGVLGVVTCC